MILYSQPLYERMAPWLGRFERRRPFRELAVERQPRDGRAVQVIVVGLGRYGSRLLRQLRRGGIEAIGVDFDPEAVRTLRRQGLPVRFGDGEDPGFVESLPLQQAGWIVTTLPSWESNRALLHALQAAGYAGRVAAAPRDPAHARDLARAGAALILNPFDDAADHAAAQLAQRLTCQEPVP
jgi:Trk K+ transport system NAD-binding subunit